MALAWKIFCLARDDAIGYDIGRNRRQQPSECRSAGGKQRTNKECTESGGMAVSHSERWLESRWIQRSPSCRGIQTLFRRATVPGDLIICLLTNDGRREVLRLHLPNPPEVSNEPQSGAREGTRTLKPFGTGSLILRVYQFRHSRVPKRAWIITRVGEMQTEICRQ